MSHEEWPCSNDLGESLRGPGFSGTRTHPLARPGPLSSRENKNGIPLFVAKHGNLQRRRRRSFFGVLCFDQDADDGLNVVGERRLNGRRALAESAMVVGGARCSYNAARVLKRETAARRDLDPSRSQREESSQNRRAIEDVRGASGGEHASAAGLDHRFQGAFEVRSFIESAMESHGHRPGHSDELKCGLDRNRAVWIEKADTDPGGADALRYAQRIGDGGKGFAGVYKCVGVGPKQHMDREAALADGLFNQSTIGREAPDLNIRADFNPISAAETGGNTCLRRLGAQFKDDSISQGFRFLLPALTGAARANVVILAFIQRNKMNK